MLGEGNKAVQIGLVHLLVLGGFQDKADHLSHQNFPILVGLLAAFSLGGRWPLGNIGEHSLDSLEKYLVIVGVRHLETLKQVFYKFERVDTAVFRFRGLFDVNRDEIEDSDLEILDLFNLVGLPCLQFFGNASPDDLGCIGGGSVSGLLLV